MMRSALWIALLAVLTVSMTVAQEEVITGDHNTPLRPLQGAGNLGVSNAVLRDQHEVRVLRVVVDAGGQRVMHSHDNVQYHLFIPISAPMQLELEGGESVAVQPWHPYFMRVGTQHGFRNDSSVPVEIMEVFVR